ncbi:sensor histidine kinase [Conyzicola sp.]|uniref:sensor histidine kinase n=1 Tax=Conyzicola sp. TaxID=1969404 RepID=UPI0039892B97
MTVRPTSLDRNVVPVEGDLRLPKPPGVIRQFWYRHPRWTDALIAASYGVPSVALHIGPTFGDEFYAGEIVPFGLALDLFGTLLLLFRRNRPWTVLVVSWVLVILSAAAWSAVDAALPAYALYALAVYGSVRAVWIGFAGSVVVVTAAGTYVGAVISDELGQIVANYFAASTFLLIVVLVAINVGNRRRYVVALLDRASQLARERDQRARLAAADERARIAREMHDIVSHGLTVMVTLAEGSAATARSDSERAADAMRQVAETGRQALTDMRRMLGLLDDGLPGELGPQPGIADLNDLVSRFRAAGLVVRFSSEGAPPADPAEQLTVYRLVQESLTNVLRHSAIPAVAEVTVRYEPSEVTVSVTNDGPVVEAPTPGGGRGTVGMRERVALYGGTIESAPRPGGGWSVVATLTHDTPSAIDTESDVEDTTTIEKDTRE